MRRAILLLLAVAPLAACNTVQTEADGGAFATLSTQTEQAAQATGRKVAAKKGAAKDAGRYFVEFRSRYALSYGHSFLVHGRLNQKGEIGALSAKNVTGFHPAGQGSELWTVGHVLPVPAETGPSDGDLEEEYVSARFRVYLTEAEYMRVAAHIRERQANPPLWHAALYNCSAWIGDIARFMGLQAPANFVQYPANYINEMRRLNTPQQVSEAPTEQASAIQ